MDGLLVIDKPAGPTSHDVVARMRRTLQEKRIGHTGTLDPAASGVLPLVVGRATRLARFLSGATKAYRATIRLGVSTDTYDAEGTTQATHVGPLPDRTEIDRVLEQFRGRHLQQPPAYSAKKIAGERSHRLARRAMGAAAAAAVPPAVKVTAFRIDVIGLEGSRLDLEVECSAGFYVRALAHDMGERLGVGAHLEALRRTRSGDLTLDDAHPLAALEGHRQAAAAAIVPPRQMLTFLPAMHLDAEAAKLARQGRLVPAPPSLRPPEGAPADAQPIRLFDPEGELVGLGRVMAPGRVHAFVVLASDLM